MNRWERKAALGFGDAQDVADRLCLSKQHVSAVINGHRRDRRVEVAVARKIGRPVDEVFPPKDEVFAATGGMV